jgi:ribosomal protein S27AE
MREWRKSHKLTGIAKLKANCRAYTRECIKRGILKRQKCQNCNSETAQAHHLDYTKPKQVVWLCRKCHLGEHKNQNKTTEQL